METRHLLQTPSVPEIRQGYAYCGLIPTSTNADTYLIRSFVAYWCGIGRAEDAVIMPSRGHSYRVVVNGIKYLVRIRDYYDHREGVVGMGCTNAEQRGSDGKPMGQSPHSAPSGVHLDTPQPEGDGVHLNAPSNDSRRSPQGLSGTFKTLKDSQGVPAPEASNDKPS